MANSVAIPQDIIDHIIEAVGNDRDFLKNCALVSSSFLHLSRKRLFSEIILEDDQACQQLHQVLIENPDIQSFVRSIAISGYYRLLEPHALIVILRLPFCCLESFSFGDLWRRSYWNDFSSDLKDAFSTVIHSPTLKSLSLTGVSAPITLFHGIHLTKLALNDFWLHDLYSDQSRLPTSAASEGVTTTASHTVVDQCVWNFYDLVHGLAEPIFLPFMCRLRVFEICVDPHSATMSDFDILSFLMRSLCISLTSPATLEHIELHLVFAGINSPFEHEGFYNSFHDADVWRHLDSMITHPIGSRLQRVNIIIGYGVDYDEVSEPDETQIMRLVFKALPLLREKGILFVEIYAGNR